MKVKSLSVLAGVAGTLVFTSMASAGYTGLSTSSFVGAGWVANGYAGLVTYRIYANFDSPTDELNAVFGSSVNPLSMSSTDGLFFNDSFFDSLTAPQDLTGPPFLYWANQWDTYVDIGLTDATGDQTQLTPGFSAEVGNLAGDFTTFNASWFVTPSTPQGIAGPDGQVLIAQLTVNAGQDVSGIVNLQFLGGAQALDQAFASAVPAPGALALLGLAGLAGTRRRRR